MLDMTRKSTPSRYYYYEQIVCEKSDVSNADMVMICGKNCCQKVQFIRSFFRHHKLLGIYFWTVAVFNQFLVHRCIIYLLTIVGIYNI